jgi:uncharacterized protein YutE (UPF0331/DUF86 family)
MTYADNLTLVAIEIVGSLVYPTATPTIEADIVEKRQDIYELINEIVDRPSSYDGKEGKLAYLAYLSDLQGELQEMIDENNQIIADNAAARTQAETDYQAALDAQKAIDTNKWEAIRQFRVEILRDCDWTHIGDSQLPASIKNEWKDYRQALRDITKDFEDPDDVVWPTPPSVTYQEDDG